MATSTVVRTGVGDRCIRVVCISDTHGKHWKLLPRIPEGDLLIHAGDFSYKLREEDPACLDKLRDFNDFLGALPHRHKVVIAGNHEIALNNVSASSIQQILSNCHYLQDSSVEIEGLKIYGTPWTNSCNMGFSTRSKNLREIWQRIPADVDILVTHLPPLNRLDLAYDHRGTNTQDSPCGWCKMFHPRHNHWGCYDLLARVHEIKPMMHVFGHVHDSNGHQQGTDTLYVNAAMDLRPRPAVVDLYTPSTHSAVAQQEEPMRIEQSDEGFVGVDGLKHAQTSQSGMWTVNLRKLRRTLHPSSKALLIEEYPVWMLPVDIEVPNHGRRFVVSAENVEALLQDEQYLAQYREAAWLLVRLWGWDLRENRAVLADQPPPNDGYLYLTQRSFQIFQQTDLLNSFKTFVDTLARRQNESPSPPPPSPPSASPPSPAHKVAPVVNVGAACCWNR